MNCLINVGSTGALCAAFYCILHVCCALEYAIHHFCLHIFEEPTAACSVEQWNVLQAMLRRAAHSVEGGFVSASTGVLCVIVLTFLELFSLFATQTYSSFVEVMPEEGACFGFWVGWVVPPTALVFYTVFRAASVSEHCDRVPAMVNCGLFEDGEIDNQKLYAVQYIRQSAAGFYIKGVHVTTTWAFKLSYMSGVLLFTLLTQSVLKTR